MQAAPPDGGIYLQVHGFFPDGEREREREQGVGGWVRARIASREGIVGCPVNYRKEEKADVSGIARWEMEETARRIY